MKSQEEKPGKKKKKRAEPEMVIPLRKPYGQLALALFFFGLCALVLYHRATTNDRGLILNGILEFERGGADIFYGVLCALSLGFCVVGVLGLVRIAQIEPFRIVVHHKGVTLPGGALIKMREVTVPLDEIVSIGTHPPAAPKHISIQAQSGIYWIQGSWLREGWTAREVADAIVDRIRRREGARGGERGEERADGAA